MTEQEVVNSDGDYLEMSFQDVMFRVSSMRPNQIIQVLFPAAFSGNCLAGDADG